MHIFQQRDNPNLGYRDRHHSSDHSVICCSPCKNGGHVCGRRNVSDSSVPNSIATAIDTSAGLTKFVHSYMTVLTVFFSGASTPSVLLTS